MTAPDDGEHEFRSNVSAVSGMVSADSGHGEHGFQDDEYRSGPKRAEPQGLTVTRLRAKPLTATSPVWQLDRGGSSRSGNGVRGCRVRPRAPGEVTGSLAVIVKGR